MNISKNIRIYFAKKLWCNFLHFLKSLHNHSLIHASDYFDLDSISFGPGGVAGFVGWIAGFDDVLDGGCGVPEGTGCFAEGFVVGIGGLSWGTGGLCWGDGDLCWGPNGLIWEPDDGSCWDALGWGAITVCLIAGLAGAGGFTEGFVVGIGGLCWGTGGLCWGDGDLCWGPNGLVWEPDDGCCWGALGWGAITVCLIAGLAGTGGLVIACLVLLTVPVGCWWGAIKDGGDSEEGIGDSEEDAPWMIMTGLDFGSLESVKWYSLHGRSKKHEFFKDIMTFIIVEVIYELKMNLIYH